MLTHALTLHTVPLAELRMQSTFGGQLQIEFNPPNPIPNIVGKTNCLYPK